MEDLCLRSMFSSLIDNQLKPASSTSNGIQGPNIFERYLDSQQHAESNGTKTNATRMFGLVNRQNTKPNKTKKHTTKISNRNATNRRRKKREFISLDSYVPSVQGPIEVGNAKRCLQKNEEERLKIRLLGINSFVPIGINKTLGTILQEREEEKQQMEAAREEEEQFQRQLQEAQQMQQTHHAQEVELEEEEEEEEQQFRELQSVASNHTTEYFSRTNESTTNSDVNMNIDLDEELQEEENVSYGFDEEEADEEEELNIYDQEVEDSTADFEQGEHEGDFEEHEGDFEEHEGDFEEHEGDFEEHEYSRVHFSSESSGHMRSGHVLDSNPDLTHEFESFSRDTHSLRVNRSGDSNSNNGFGDFLLSEPSMFPELGK
ncbi:hypothetical protein ACO0RG_003834 [Hanseniaspora osmophila]